MRAVGFVLGLLGAFFFFIEYQFHGMAHLGYSVFLPSLIILAGLFLFKSGK